MVGILSQEEGQIVFYDTPGIHRPMHRMNREMVREAADALGEADIVCLLIDISQPFGKGEAFLLDLVSKAKQPKIALLNKIDLVKKNKLLPILERYGKEGIFDAIIPISAETGDGCDGLLRELWKLLPDGEPLYDKELLTIHPERFLVAERIREKILRETRNELPFSTAVLIERWEDPGPEKALRIHAALLVEREGQKKILIGHGGEMVKTIGTAARHDLEEFLGRKVFLDLRVRTEEDWRENPRIIADIKRDLHAGTTLDVDDLNEAANDAAGLEQLLDGLDEKD
jgi:GTP-binding protein Era